MDLFNNISKFLVKHEVSINSEDKIQIARFAIESKINTGEATNFTFGQFYDWNKGNGAGQDGQEKNEESDSSLKVVLMDFWKDSNEYVGKYLVLTKVKGNKILLDLFDSSYYMNDEYRDRNFYLEEQLEIEINPKRIIESKEYKLSQEFKNLSNEELFDLMLSYEDLNEGRKALINRYGTHSHARLTWIMYNLKK